MYLYFAILVTNLIFEVLLEKARCKKHVMQIISQENNLLIQIDHSVVLFFFRREDWGIIGYTFCAKRLIFD